MLNSGAITIISSNSNSSGPFNISWMDSGTHVVEVQTFSADGCRSAPTYDTVYVHASPDADFQITSTNQSGCIDDTVQFTADMANYNDSYQWAPASSFENVNTPVAWGKIQYANTVITLTVTDPFGCTATQSMELDPNSCCTVWFPNAFTPNGDGKDDYFRPLYTGYHHFHVFEIMNRWGQIVFTSENNNLQWDGNHNGVPQDMGVYYYYLKYDCGGKTMEAKGDVTLIR
jgi:gliding motility-associated-like protein